MSAIHDIRIRARRAELFGALVETFETPAERKGVVMKLWDTGIISSQSAELLIETYGLEAA